MRVRLPLTLLAIVLTGCAPRGNAGVGQVAAPGESADTTSGVFFKNTGVGTDAYAGPFDVLFNKGYAVTQWRQSNRRIFDHQYGWGAVESSLLNPGEAVQRAGGWKEVFLVHAMPFYYGGARDPQWVTNYFGHVLEGGISYRRLAEWNEAKGVPLPRTTAALVTYVSSIVNEAYETPPPPPGVEERGNAGIVMDLLFFDPLGILLFSSDRIAGLSRHLNAQLWPQQASVVVNRASLQNNGQSLVMKLPLPWTDHRLFLRGGIGVEAGISFRRNDRTDLTFSMGVQSYERQLNPVTELESAEFSLSAGTWIDRDGVLLASITLDAKTDRRVALNLYPGFMDIGGVKLGSWLLFDSAGRPYVGITGRSLGVGIGWGF